MKISKELVSEVFKLNICEAYIENNILYFDMGLPLIQSINLYEFAFKCKEWALSKGYFIYSTHELSFIKSLSLETVETFANGKDTELECIIKASEWLLKEGI